MVEAMTAVSKATMRADKCVRSRLTDQLIPIQSFRNFSKLDADSFLAPWKPAVQPVEESGPLDVPQARVPLLHGAGSARVSVLAEPADRLWRF
jgi:hypothetical protein